MKKLLFTLLIVSLCAFVFANGETENVAQTKTEMVDTVTIGVTGWPKSLDTVVQMGVTVTRWINQVYDTLLYCENDGTVSSYICDSWKKLDDTTAEFKLKSGITFHDGKALTAKDVKFSFDRVLFDKTGYVDPNIRAVVGTIKEVQAVDDSTVRIITKTVDPILFNRLASYLSVYIVPENLGGKSNDEFGVSPVGTGPYKVVSISPEKLELTYYEGFYGDKPVAKNLVYKYVSEDSALATGLITGELDIAPDLSIASADIVKARASKDVAVTNLAYSASHLLRFNTKKGITADKKLRQALSLAIDRQLLVDTLWNGYASVPNGYNYKDFGEFYVPDYPAYEYNVEKAKQLVAESNYKGEVISYQVVPGYYAMGVEAAEAIVDMWKQIGVNAQVEYVDVIKTKTIKNVANWSNGLRFADPLGGLWVLWGEGTGPQKDLWNAPARFNELGHKVEVESDVAQRRAYYKEMMQIWDDEVIGTILYCPDYIWAVNTKFNWDYQPGRAINFRAGFLTSK